MEAEPVLGRREVDLVTLALEGEQMDVVMLLAQVSKKQREEMQGTKQAGRKRETKQKETRNGTREAEGGRGAPPCCRCSKPPGLHAS